MSRRPARLGRVLAGAALVLLTACGGADDSRTELVDALEAIDASVTGSDDDLVLQRIDELVERTEDARDAGDISDAEAEQVLAAAEALREAVLAGAGDDPTDDPTEPTTGPTSGPTTDPTRLPTVGPSPPTSSPTSEAPEDDEDDDEEEDDRRGPGGGPGGRDDEKDDGPRGPREP